MPNPYLELEADTFDYEADWLEVVGDTAPGGGATLSNDGQEATLVGLVPWNKQRSCARWFLGFNYTEYTGGVYVLRREQPAQHPVFPWLRAATIGFAPLVVKANTANPSNKPYVASPFDEDVYTGYYEKAVATVRYRNFRCSFGGDATISEGKYEWQRNTVFDATPKIEAISADGTSNLKFVETDAGGPTLNESFAAPIAALMAKFGLRITWLNVPIEYVSGDSYYAFPENMLNCLGRLNDASWLDGIPAGTAFLEAVGIQEKTAPIASDDIANPLRYLDIMLDVSYFNPEKGKAASSYRGHNLMPFRGDGKWYYAERASSGRPLFQPVDFDQIFEGVA